MKKYNVNITATEWGFVEVEAETKEEAIEKAHEAEIDGEIIWGERELKIEESDVKEIEKMKNYIVVFSDIWNLFPPKEVQAESKDKAISLAVDLATPYTDATIQDEEGKEYGTYSNIDGGTLFGIDFA